MEDWRSLHETLAAACEEPDKETAERAVRAAELVASTAGEPPDDLSDEDRAWAEQHGIPPTELVDLACRSMKCVAAPFAPDSTNVSLFGCPICGLWSAHFS